MIWLRYVALPDVAGYLAKGWVISDDMALIHHGTHAVLMVWEGGHEPG